MDAGVLANRQTMAALILLGGCGRFGFDGEIGDYSETATSLELDAGANGLADGAPAPDGGGYVPPPPDAGVPFAGPDPAAFQFTVEYSNRNGARRTYDITSQVSSPLLRFYFADSNGRFHNTPWAGCEPTAINPDFVYITVGVTGENLLGCRFRGSWDESEVTCSAGQVQSVRDGFRFILGTDANLMGPGPECLEQGPHFPHQTSGWFEVTFITPNGEVTKRVNLYKLPL